MYCPCGYNRVSRDVVYDHQSSHQYDKNPGHGPRAGYIYQVDRPSYYNWATKVMGWVEPPPFPDPHPTLRGEQSKSLSHTGRNNQGSPKRRPRQENRRTSSPAVRQIQDRPMPDRARSSRATTSRPDSRSQQREHRRHSVVPEHRSRSRRAGGRQSGPSSGVEHLGERHPDVRHGSRTGQDRTLDHSRTPSSQSEILPPPPMQRPHPTEIRPSRDPSHAQDTQHRPPVTVIRSHTIPLEAPPPQQDNEPASGVEHLEAEETTQADDSRAVNPAPEEATEIAEGGVGHSPQPATEGSGAEDSAETTSEDELTRTGDDRTLGDRSLLRNSGHRTTSHQLEVTLHTGRLGRPYIT